MREDRARRTFVGKADACVMFWYVWDGVPCSLWWESVLENRILGLLKGQFLPAAQPWWAAGCAVTGVLGHTEGPVSPAKKARKKCYQLKIGEIRVRGGSRGFQTLDTFFRDSERG